MNPAERKRGSAQPELTVISKIADAIAFAEGFYVPGSRPCRNNNPGDLERDLPKESGDAGTRGYHAHPE
jgi:hypothetical protein